MFRYFNKLYYHPIYPVRAMSLEAGCRTVVETCMEISQDDRAVVLTDDESKKIGDELRKQVMDKTSNVRYFNLDLYGERPLDNFPQSIKEEVKKATATIWTAHSVKGELKTVRVPFFENAVVGGRHAHMVNITEEIMERAMGADYEKIAAFTEKINSKAKGSDVIRIKTEKGTDLKSEVGMNKWVPSTGLIREKGKWVNLPDGEIFTAPKALEGTAVIDGTIGDYFGEEYSPLEIDEASLTLEIENREKPTLVDMTSENEELTEELWEYVNEECCSRWVGELGIGTNIFLEGVIGNMLMDEKYPGAHIAFGDPNDPQTFAGWSCPTHIDMLMKDCDIWFDDEKIMEKGEYLVSTD